MKCKIKYIVILLTSLLIMSQIVVAGNAIKMKSPELLSAVRGVTAMGTDKRINLKWKLAQSDAHIISRVLLYRKDYSIPMAIQTRKQAANIVDKGKLIASLPSKAVTYQDEKVEVNKRYYYRLLVEAEDKTRSILSVPAIAMLKDIQPPEKVIDIQAQILNAESFKLSWQASESNDVESYRLYRKEKNSKAVIVRHIKLKDKNTSRITALIKLKKNLQKHYYYSIAAVDGAGNVSSLSPYVHIRLPDSIAPRNPMLLTIANKKNGLLLKWKKNTEDDLKGYKVYRKKNNKNEEFQLITKHIITNNSVFDSSVKPLSDYRYRVSALDNYNNESKAGIGIAARTGVFDQPVAAPEKLRIKKAKNGFPELNWKMPKKSKIRVFRSDGGGYIPVSGLLQKNNFIDSSIKAGRAYKYQVKAVSIIGDLSTASNNVMWHGGK